MGIRRTSALAIATVLAAGGAVLASYPALAEPSGCTHNSGFWVSASGSRQLMHADSSGSCNTSANRTLRVEIKHDLNFQPDALVAAQSDSRTSTSYYTSVQSCDNNNSGTYYGRGFFTSSPTYIDTPHYTVSAC